MITFESQSPELAPAALLDHFAGMLIVRGGIGGPSRAINGPEVRLSWQRRYPRAGGLGGSSRVGRPPSIVAFGMLRYSGVPRRCEVFELVLDHRPRMSSEAP